MQGDSRLNRKQIIMIGIAVMLIIAALTLGAIQMLHDDQSTEPQEQTYQANATFVAASGNITFRCEVADSYEERQTGLMDRESLANDTGMLFVFDSPQTVSFWMKNTLIPLDIVFINETGHVINIAQAYPEPGVSDSLLTRYPSSGPVLWVLEINQGICVANGIGPGTYVDLQY